MTPNKLAVWAGTALLCGLGTVHSSSAVRWYQTERASSDRLTEKHLLVMAQTQSEVDFVVTVDPTVSHQKILGFGGALTQASASVYRELPVDMKSKVIESYYGPSGIGYTIGRLPIHSCDFSEDMYTFDDVSGDSALEHFDSNITYDQTLSLPLIHDALNANPNLLLYGSPWSPPAWMKDNNEMCCGGKLLSEYRDSWANYISKWISAYTAQSVPLWGITVQNEPEASQSWESCLYTAEETRDFVAEHLGPVLEKDHPGIHLLAFDHNKDHIVSWADIMMGPSSASAQYVDGIAFHWYSGSCFDNVKNVSVSYPDAILLPSEACYELTVMEDDESEEDWLAEGTWSKGEGYGYDILGDLESGAVGWTDWNILLNSEGGPNHVNNFCDAAMIADVTSEVVQLYYHPQYYYMGHFSKFISPGSIRVQSEVAGQDRSSSCNWPYGECDGNKLHVTSFISADNSSLTIVAMNCGSEGKTMSVSIDGTAGYLENDVPANSIQTYVVAL